MVYTLTATNANGSAKPAIQVITQTIDAPPWQWGCINFTSNMTYSFSSIAANISSVAANTTCSSGAMPFRYLLPAGYNPATTTYPVVLFLHGAGESISSTNASSYNQYQLSNGIYELSGVKAPSGTTDSSVGLSAQQLSTLRAATPAIIVAPQYYGTNTDWGGNSNSSASQITAVNLVQYIASTMGGDSTRVYVTGLSKGGIGTWTIIAKNNKNNYGVVFAAAMPLSGQDGYFPGDSGSKLTTETLAFVKNVIAASPALASTPIWAIHGGADTTVPPLDDQDFCSLICSPKAKQIAPQNGLQYAPTSGGGNMQYTEVSGAGHNIPWSGVYDTTTIYWDWLFQQHL
jgi:predicted peptidase